jgi:peroxiredoxin
LVDSLSVGKQVDANFQFSKEVLLHKFPVIKQFVLAHINSPVSVDILDDFALRSKEADMVQAAFDQLSPALRNSPSAVELADRIKGMRAVGVGDMAPPFTIPDTEGKMVSLSDFKGKYVLVDFWATWCGPCVAEIPNLIKAHNEYKSKNFDIISISLDRPDSRERWLNKIRETKMDWPQVSELKWWKGRSALLYNINSVPANFLVDPQGKIIAVNLRGQMLEKKLAEIL